MKRSHIEISDSQNSQQPKKSGKRLRKIKNDDSDEEPPRPLKRLKRQKSPPGVKTSSLDEASGKDNQDEFESDFIDDGEPEVYNKNEKEEESEASCNEDYSMIDKEEEE